jgi:hypothetical protein
MVAIVVTAANVSLISGDALGNQVAASAITPGQAISQLDNGTWGLAQGDGTVVEAGANNVGIALSGASAAGQLLSVATGARNCIVGFGAGVLLAGFFYTVGDASGAIVPSADNGSTDKATLIGQAISTSQLMLIRAYHPGAVLA